MGGGSGRTSGRAEVLARIETGLDAQAKRYWQVPAVIRGDEPHPTTVPDFRWLAQALRAAG